jgi:MoaA/NifB/PqqE/SkfB family radical SAM enzyme
MPVFVMMFVTSRCDARCRYCFYWRNLNRNVDDELSIDEIDALARSIGPILQVTLTGGSPELREDLPEVARSFSRHCRPAGMTICMNGFHTERILSQVDDVLRTCPEQKLNVGLPLDGIGEEHDRLRGLPGLFDRLVETYRGLGELRAVHPRLSITCGVLVSDLNRDTASATARWARENLPIDRLKPTLVRVEPAPPESALLSNDSCEAYMELVRAEDRWLRTSGAGRGSLLDCASRAKEKVVREVCAEIWRTGRSPCLCGAARENVMIYPDGTVPGCEARPEVLGNLRDVGMDLSKLWYTASAREFRQKARHCTCHHHGFLSLAVFRSPRMWPRLARAAVTAARTRGPSLSAR